MVPFGPYRGQHHQYDRLSLTVWPFSRDAGSPLYGLPARKAWYPHSYAHNTLVVDGQSHADCGGELLDWNGRCLSVAAPDAYPGVRFERTIEIARMMPFWMNWLWNRTRHTPLIGSFISMATLYCHLICSHCQAP